MNTPRTREQIQQDIRQKYSLAAPSARSYRRPQPEAAYHDIYNSPSWNEPVVAPPPLRYEDVVTTTGSVYGEMAVLVDDTPKGR